MDTGNSVLIVGGGERAVGGGGRGYKQDRLQWKKNNKK